jgi:Ca2+-binding RTX toxin-like protein
LTGSAGLTAEGNGDVMNVITANSGNDSITGSAYSSTIYGGSGFDTLDPGPQLNVIYAGNGGTTANPTYVNGNDPNTNSGTQTTIYGGTGTELLYGGPGTDLIYGGSGVDSLYGGTGYDTLVAGTGTDSFLSTGTSSTPVFQFNSGFTQDSIGADFVNETINFGTGITPSSFVASASIVGGNNLDLLLTDGSDSILVNDGLLPGTIGTLNFASSGAESLAQLMTADGPGTQLLTYEGNPLLLVSSNSLNLAATGSYELFDVYGSADTLSDTYYGGTFDVYGNSDVMSGSNNVNVSGNSDIATMVGGDITVSGANDTIDASGSSITVDSSSTVIQGSAGAGNIVYAYTQYTLPASSTSLYVEAGGIAASSNSTGGTLEAESSYDTLTGSSGADTLIANGTDDVLVGGSGAEAYELLQNTDSLVYGSGNASLNSVYTTFSYTLTGGADTLTVAATGAVAQGDSNNDYISAGGENNTLIAGSGNDTLVAGYLDTIVAGAGNDLFVMDNEDDVIEGASSGSSNTAELAFNTGSDVYSYTLPTNVNTLIATEGKFAVSANSGNDSLVSDTYTTIIGGSGLDTLVAEGAVDSLVAGNNNDTFVLQNPANGADTLTFDTGYKNDTVIGSYGGDVIDFGSGILESTLTFAPVTTAFGSAPSFAVSGAGGAVTLSGGLVPGALSRVTFGDGTSATIPQIFAPTGRSTITGSGGNYIFSSVTNDTITGGSGEDTILTWGSGDSLTAGTGGSEIYADGSGDIVHGGSGNDDLIALGDDDSITGGSARDTLVAANGNNYTYLYGGTGIDTMIGAGSLSTNYYFVNNSSDVVIANAAANINVVEATSSFVAPTGVDLYLEAHGISGTGAAGTVVEGDGGDTLIAGAGNESLYSGSSGDTLVAGSGSDYLSASGGEVEFNSGFGTAAVGNSSTTATDIAFGTGISSSNITASAYLYGLTLTDGTSTISLGGALTGTAYEFQFGANGPVSLAQFLSEIAVTSSTVAGSDGNLILDGTASTSVLGGSGEDSIFAAAANDTLEAGAGYQILEGFASNDLLVGNSTGDTLSGLGSGDTMTAGSGNETLVGGASANVAFVVNSASDIVSVGTSGLADTIESSASYTLPTNVQYLTLTGTSALTATGNSALDLLVGNTGADTLVGGTGIAALEGGTAGSDQIKASSNQAALIARSGSSTLTGGTYKDFYAAGLVSDSITTGATANVVSVNDGDGATTLAPTTSATNVLSLGHGIDTENLEFNKSGNNLVLTDGVAGDSITFTNWYVGSADQDYKTLQVIEIASPDYNSGGGDPLRNKPIEAFNFSEIASAYIAAGSPTNWFLSTVMASASLTTSASADYGGDLAYYFGLNGNLTGVDLSDVSSVLTNSSYATGTQAINSFGSISGGGGLHLLVKTPAPILPVNPTSTRGEETGGNSSAPTTSSHLAPTPIPTAPIEVVPSDPFKEILPERGPETRPTGNEPTPRLIEPRYGMQGFADIAALIRSLEPDEIPASTPTHPMERPAPLPRYYVDPINLQWLTMHGRLDGIDERSFGGVENAEHDEATQEVALMGAVPLSQLRRTTGEPELGRGPGRHNPP